MDKILNFLKKKKGNIQFLLFLTLAFYAIQKIQTAPLIANKETAPGFQLYDTSGNKYDLASYRGKSLVLYFFAPWCSICRTTVGNLEYLKSLRSSGKLEILSIGLDYSDAKQIARYQKDHNMSIPVLLGDESVSEAYRIRGFPTVYFIDKEGKVSASSLGYISTIGLYFRSL